MSKIDHVASLNALSCWLIGNNHDMAVSDDIHDPAVSAIHMEHQAERIHQLEEMLRGISEFLHTAPAESGVCCCGSPMEGHGYWDGHSPVDMFSHSADRWVTDARALLGAKT